MPVKRTMVKLPEEKAHWWPSLRREREDFPDFCVLSVCFGMETIVGGRQAYLRCTSPIAANISRASPPNRNIFNYIIVLLIAH